MVDLETFREFGRIVNADYHVSETRNRTETLVIDDPEDTGRPIEITWNGHDDPDNPRISVTHHIPSIGASFSFTAPASGWITDQRIDDHNLLTKLQMNQRTADGYHPDGGKWTTAVSVYGPPARHDMGINVENADNDEYLLD